jgi:hypothetical protein
MASISLLNSTDHPKVDDILRGIVGLFETIFPERVRGYYLIGSYADGSAVASSDIDVFVVFKDTLNSQETERAHAIWKYASMLSPIRLDAPARSEREFLRAGHVIMKMASLLMYGEDIRSQIPPTPFETYLAHTLVAVHAYFGPILRKMEQLKFPLIYPDPQGRFYGYDQEETRSDEGFFGGGAGGTKPLVASVGRTAQAIIALKTGRYVVKKGECIRVYRESINDRWSGFLQKIDDNCRKRWEYSIPEGKEEQALLREMCRNTLVFENHFLAIYRDYVLKELASELDDSVTWMSAMDAHLYLGMPENALLDGVSRGTIESRVDDGERLFGVRNFSKLNTVTMLKKLVCADRAVVDVLEALESCSDVELRRAAKEAREVIQAEQQG